MSGNVDAVLNLSHLPPKAGSVASLLRWAGNSLSLGSGKLEIAEHVAAFTSDEALGRLLHADRRERDQTWMRLSPMPSRGFVQV